MFSLTTPAFAHFAKSILADHMAQCCVRLSSVSLSSICRLSVTYVLWLITKRYVLPKNCPKKQIGFPDRYPVVPYRTPYDSHSSPKGVLIAPQILALRIAAKPLPFAPWLLLTACRNLPAPYPTYHGRPPTDTCSPEIGVPTPKICIPHYGQTVSAELLLLTGCRHLPMSI